MRPFVKRQKNDAADAEAIVVAAQRPEMRFVEPKSEPQQSAAILYRSRQRLVRQRTETLNALRAALYEFGHVIPQGIQHVGRIRAILEEPMLVAIALANKMARQIWAMLTKNRDYKDPMPVMTA